MKNSIKLLREEKRITQKQLASQVNVSRQAINAIENEKFEPSIWLAYDLAKYFGLSIEDLFHFEESDRK
ncbi:transcriptional regulator [Chryseomicrobium excrementi]|uniref:Transcriptional regulator n=1 Tax=Chryseomicrobium excrementi TaxID=2041346 RepID=A0A2M9EXJ3_9BACL|nr:helix-turn-helix transcriptional regulator [Chryseomicrobium excrementi]PJK15932.1 transcriptional regulator [Chryseomicrobium excrementi]